VNNKIVALMLGAALAAGGRVNADEKPKVTTAKEAPAKAPKIVVEPLEFDFGKALQNKTLTKEFSIRNFGSVDLKIDNVTTSCGCTAAIPGEKVIKPGGSTPLHVELQTRSAVGKIERTILVRSDDPSTSVFEVKVKADVVADSPAEKPAEKPADKPADK
jgi:Protein of unknown function (DUF1573)